MKVVSLREHHPLAWLEVGVDHASATQVDGAGAPVAARGAEADLVQQISGEHPLRDVRDQILGHRGPGRGGRGGGGGTAASLGAVVVA